LSANRSFKTRIVKQYMSRVVRVAGRLVELSGLHGVWLGVDHTACSRITLFYPNGPTKTIDYAYGQWAEAEKDKKILEDAKLQLEVHRQAELQRVLPGTGPSDQSLS
jgi:hypothetical protein